MNSQVVENFNDKRRGVELAWLSKGRQRTGVQIQRFVVVATKGQSANPSPAGEKLNGDVVICRTWNGIVEGTALVPVARPWELQQSVFDGFLLDGFAYDYDGPDFRIKTRESDGKEEQQVIVPSYKALGDVRQIIYAARGVDGGSGAYYDQGEFVGEIWIPNLQLVPWIDLNLGGRAWAKKAGATSG